MRILLTGSSGMVGRNLANHPEYSQFEWLTPSHRELDLLQYKNVENYLIKNKPDIIIHAAGKVGGIQANINEPVRFLVENLDMGKNILLAAQKCEVKNLINIGSSCMYPRNKENALIEEDIFSGELEPTNEGYALAKISVAKLAQYLCKEDETLNYKTIIPCNLYGPFDKFDQKNSHLIPAAIHKLHLAKVNGLKTVEIWGDGSARREFMFANDLAIALIKACRDIKNLPNLMNLGLGFDFSVNQYYQAIADVIGFEGEFIHNLSKPVGMNRKLTSVQKANQWGWTASTELKYGLALTYDYYLTLNQGT